MDIYIFAATGNWGKKTIGYPASSPYVYSVAASTYNNELYALGNYTEEVDFIAPDETILTTTIDGTYGFNLETSYAVTFVSGLTELESEPDTDGKELERLREFM